MAEPASDNPLLFESGLPPFDLIRPEHVEPAIRVRLAELGRDLEELERAIDPSWSGLVEPLERLTDRLERPWSVVGHLMGVQNSPALREAYEKAQPDVVAFGLRLGQSRPIYDGLRALRKGPGWPDLDRAQQRIVETLLRDARLTGVGLEGADRDRFNEIQRELAELATRFGNHVLDATKAWSLTLREPSQVEDLPESWRALAAQAARDESEGSESSPERGPWRVTLDLPSFLPFMQHCRSRDLREQIYRAYITRASAGEYDNAPLIARILALRREQARLLGFSTYAELSLASKMARDVDAVDSLLEDLRQASRESAHRDLAELAEFAADRGAAEADGLQLWDQAFWSERLREHRFSYSEEELRPYFPLPVVLEGLFTLAAQLFDVTFESADSEVARWHEDVRFFRVRDAEGQEIAAFFLDPYSRPEEKRGGAWMDECVGRTRLFDTGDGSARLPVAYLVCNQAPPVADQPSLMSFQEVTTLFHEFGHGLQHMLTTVDYGLASGIRNVEWDAVELPSQFMENFCYQRATLRSISAHVESGEPLPDSTIEKLRAARCYRAGSDMLRQLYFALTDLELHHRLDPGGEKSAFEIQRQVAKRTTILPPLSEDRFLCCFGHIFGGGYAAGYYGYKWAEVLSADAFAAFEEAGLEDEASLAAMGRRFRDAVLAQGGSRPPMEVFVEFRGREPTVDALLRHSGLQEA